MQDEIPKMAFSIDEAALCAGLGRDGIYKAIRENRLEAKKFGRRTLITADALRRFLAELPVVGADAPSPGSTHRGGR